MPRGMGSPERAMFDPTKKAENKASFAAMNKELGVKPVVEAKGRWKKVDRSEKKPVGSDTVMPVEEFAQDAGYDWKAEAEAEASKSSNLSSPAELEAQSARLKAAAEARDVGAQIIYESVDDIDTDEVEKGIENKDNEADALLDQWVDYLSDPDVNMMSESGKVLVDVQKLYDLGLTEKSLEDIRKKARDRSAPVKKDVYGQAGRQTRAA